ncbi:hypothetical protein KTAU_13070 [Thermogemmatispora aurantia]|uniref:Uncharacterized protein n=1 Tax=Thermogemmatispora aurantia TaxID=2045279 RepID=A0A5J4K7L3_9CHLR|nr:hypothetical protein KTAU_13070 [Thermogemmatispora aurantia]
MKIRQADRQTTVIFSCKHGCARGPQLGLWLDWGTAGVGLEPLALRAVLDCHFCSAATLASGGAAG